MYFVKQKLSSFDHFLSLKVLVRLYLKLRMIEDNKIRTKPAVEGIFSTEKAST